MSLFAALEVWISGFGIGVVGEVLVLVVLFSPVMVVGVVVYVVSNTVLGRVMNDKPINTWFVMVLMGMMHELREDHKIPNIRIEHRSGKSPGILGGRVLGFILYWDFDSDDYMTTHRFSTKVVLCHELGHAIANHGRTIFTKFDKVYATEVEAWDIAFRLLGDDLKSDDNMDVAVGIREYALGSYRVADSLARLGY